MRIIRTTLIIIITILLSASLAVSQAPQDVEEKMRQANADLDMIAREISKISSHPGFRGFLRSEISKSKNRENILELDKFLNRAMKQKGMPQELANAKDLNLKSKGRLKASAIWNLEELAHQGYDLYIPVEAHKAKWRGGKDFLVASGPVNDEKDIKQIVAYQVRDGKRVFLDPKNAPKTTLLIVAPCEHPTHEPAGAGKVVREAPDKEPKNLKGGPDPAPGDENTYIGVPYVKITTDREAWYMGKPEVYVIVAQSYKTTPKLKKVWLNSGSRDVNNVNQWYYIGDCTTCPLYVYFDSNYSDVTYYGFWEFDGGAYLWRPPNLSFPFLGSVISWGVSLEVRISAGDDYFGSKYINKNSIPYSGYHLQSNGYVHFKVDKDP